MDAGTEYFFNMSQPGSCRPESICCHTPSTFAQRKPEPSHRNMLPFAKPAVSSLNTLTVTGHSLVVSGACAK